MTRFCVIAACAVLVGLAAASAAGHERGWLRAKSFGEPPAGAPIGLSYLQDTELNQRVAMRIERELAARGHRADPDARLVLHLDSLVVRDDERDTTVGLSGRGGSRSRSDLELTIEIPLGKDARKRLGAHVQLNLRLAERGRAPLWEAAAVRALEGRDRFSVAEELVRRIMAEFGRTVERRPL